MNRLAPVPRDLPASHDSNIVHLVCCRDDGPTLALCGWLVDEPMDENDPRLECARCCAEADRFEQFECIYGGRCPE